MTEPKRVEYERSRIIPWAGRAVAVVQTGFFQFASRPVQQFPDLPDSRRLIESIPCHRRESNPAGRRVVAGTMG